MYVYLFEDKTVSESAVLIALVTKGKTKKEKGRNSYPFGKLRDLLLRRLE